jgi:hypothetical protein
MGNQIENNAIQKAKDYLQITEEIATIDLYKRLRDYRNGLHPDRVLDANNKKIAEERFKEAQVILQNLQILIEQEKLNKPSVELVAYSPQYEIFLAQYEADQFKDKLAEAEKQIALSEWFYSSEQKKNNELIKALQQKRSLEIQEEQKKLKSLYETPLKEKVAFGLILLLAGCLAVISQMETMAAQLQNYCPFPEKYVTAFLLFLIFCLVVSAFKKAGELSFITRKSEEVCSPKYAENFRLFLAEKGKGAEHEFNEYDAFAFIEGNGSWYKMILGFLGFKIFRQATINRLKDIFLNNLLNKKIIEISMADSFQRVFTIKKTG